MTEQKPETVFIDDKEYNLDDLTDSQKVLVRHVADLDRKIKSAQFNLDQLTVGREAFVGALSNSLKESEQMSEEVAAE